MKNNRRRFLAGISAATVAASAAGAALAADPVPQSATAPETIFTALIRAIIAFDDPRFPRIRPEELVGRIVRITNILADSAYCGGLAAFDAASGPSGFSNLALDDARHVINGWLMSPNAVQRAFVSTTKAVAVIALYSDPRIWPAIRYAGPFDAKLTGAK